MRHSSHPRKMDVGRRRYPVALLSLLIILAQWSSFAHLVLVPHVLCLDHGEFVESSETEAGTSASDPGELPRSAALLPRASGARTAVVRAARNLDAAHAHEHCWIAAHTRNWLPLPEDELAAWAVLPPESVDGGALAPEVRSSAIALLRLAPKTSPPPRTSNGEPARA